MVKKILGLVVLLVVSTAANAEECQHSVDEKPVILVLGDSLSSAYGIELSQGWVSLLQERLLRKELPHRIVNASISGDTTMGGRNRLKMALPKHQPSLVVIALGGNDGLRGLPLASVESNLREMITSSLESGAQVVLLGMRIPSNYGQRYTEKFHSIYGKLATEFSLPVVGFFMEGVALKPALFQPDGIHPNVAAQPILLNTAWPAIQEGMASTCK